MHLFALFYLQIGEKDVIKYTPKVDEAYLESSFLTPTCVSFT